MRTYAIPKFVKTGYLVGARSFSKSSVSRGTEALILSAVRTPIGSFRSSLAPLTAQQLGSQAIKVLFD